MSIGIQSKNHKCSALAKCFRTGHLATLTITLANHSSHRFTINLQTKHDRQPLRPPIPCMFSSDKTLPSSLNCTRKQDFRYHPTAVQYNRLTRNGKPLSPRIELSTDVRISTEAVENLNSSCPLQGNTRTRLGPYHTTNCAIPAMDDNFCWPLTVTPYSGWINKRSACLQK